LSETPTDMAEFVPAAFFARAARRLHHEPPLVNAGGDHVLNPDFVGKQIDYHDAAVLIPVVARSPAVGALLTRRTPHLSAHGGQIAFPGGKIDPTDAGPAAAALREAREEIGLDPATVEIVGHLDAYLTGTGYRVMPVLGRVEPGQRFVPNRQEVEEIFEVPLAFLMTPANHRRTSRVFMGGRRTFYEMPFEGRNIWGATAGIIRALYERMYC